jgi:hypothetical protein
MAEKNSPLAQRCKLVVPATTWSVDTADGTSRRTLDLQTARLLYYK